MPGGRVGLSLRTCRGNSNTTEDVGCGGVMREDTSTCACRVGGGRWMWRGAGRLVVGGREPRGRGGRRSGAMLQHMEDHSPAAYVCHDTRQRPRIGNWLYVPRSMN